MEQLYGLHSTPDNYSHTDPNNSCSFPAAEFLPFDSFSEQIHMDQMFSATSPSAISDAASMQRGRNSSSTAGSEDEVSTAIREKIAFHPLYPKLLQAYIDCQKVMVSLGKMREEFKETMTSPAPQKSKPPLHNFTMPWLQWGNKKLMRCVKVNDSNGQVPTPTSFDHRRPSERVLIGRFRDSEFQRPGSTDPIRDESLKLTPRDDGIEAVREKLMIDLQTAADKMKSAFLRDRLPEQSVTAKDSSDALRPWNLRTRRAACKEPRMSSAGGNQQPNWSPVRTETVKSSSRFLPGNAVATANVIGELTSGEKRDRAKFSVALTRGDIADDFMAMSGHRLPRRPKKRPKYVQKQLDTLFPGLWLVEINADLYKVPDATETGKR